MAEGGEVKEASAGKGGFVVALLLLAVLGAGAGAGFSMMFFKADASVPGKTVAGKHDPHMAAASGKPGDGHGATKGPEAGASADPHKEQVVSVDPILVTLAGPQKDRKSVV